MLLYSKIGEIQKKIIFKSKSSPAFQHLMKEYFLDIKCLYDINKFDILIHNLICLVFLGMEIPLIIGTVHRRFLPFNFIIDRAKEQLRVSL